MEPCAAADFYYMDTYALPRFGPGAWLQLLEMLYARASGRELRVLRHGKPNPPAYTCAAHKLARQLGPGARPLQHIYAIGCGPRMPCVAYGFTRSGCGLGHLGARARARALQRICATVCTTLSRQAPMNCRLQPGKGAATACHSLPRVRAAERGAVMCMQTSQGRSHASVRPVFAL